MGVGSMVAFVIVEARAREPMLPLGLFASRPFTGVNLVTLAVYGALSAVTFLLVVELQQVLGYSPVQAGLASLPVTAIMFVLSPRAGQLGQRIGARIPLTVGPLVVAGSMTLMARIDAGSDYLLDVLPPLIVFGLGMSLTVAPLTATVMAAVEARHAGVASAVNNAVARAAGLVAVAVLPPLAGLTGSAYLDPVAFSQGFHRAVLICAGVTALGGVVGWILLGERRPAARKRTHDDDYSCSIGAPPLRLTDGREPERVGARDR
jgi:MFS family permease